MSFIQQIFSEDLICVRYCTASLSTAVNKTDKVFDLKDLEIQIGREMQIKTTMKHYFTPVRVAFIERQEITNVGMEKRELLCTVGRNVNW